MKYKTVTERTINKINKETKGIRLSDLCGNWNEMRDQIIADTIYAEAEGVKRK